MMPTGAVGTTAGESRGVYPSAYWGFFSVTPVMRLGKSPNRLWLFEKPSGVGAVKLSAARALIEYAGAGLRN